MPFADCWRSKSARPCTLHVLIAHASASKMFSDDNLFTVGWQGGVKSCSLTLLPPPAKRSIDKTSPCTWHSKVNRLLNPDMPTRCEPCSRASSFWWSICFSFAPRNGGKGLRRKTQEGVKLAPGGQVCLMCHAALELRCKWNKDTYGSHWL